MNEAKHTIAPWAAADDGEVYSEPIHRSICMVLQAEGWRANALVIAAAPDLLAVARMALAVSAMETGRGPVPAFSPDDLYEAARAAVAKADG